MYVRVYVCLYVCESHSDVNNSWMIHQVKIQLCVKVNIVVATSRKKVKVVESKFKVRSVQVRKHSFVYKSTSVVLINMKVNIIKC